MDGMLKLKDRCLQHLHFFSIDNMAYQFPVKIEYPLQQLQVG
uniref:Uncharacterized protein n=1 Tax=Rhizophora mucronata TaxID=61149 RepID=A0A2P2QRG2_RHIMU